MSGASTSQRSSAAERWLPVLSWGKTYDRGQWSADMLAAGIVTLMLVDHVTSLGVMLTLVGAGYGIGFAIASQVEALNRPDIATRPLAGTPPMLSTYLVRRGGEPSEPLKRFISRVKRLNAPTPDEGGA